MTLPDPGRTVSPRIVPIAVFTPVPPLAPATQFQPQSQYQTSNMLGFFVEAVSAGPPATITGRLLLYPGSVVAGAMPTFDRRFLKVIRLIR
jgi:hypothetical protein